MRAGLQTFVSILILVLFLAGTAAAESGGAAGLIAQGDSLIKSGDYPGALAAYDQAIAVDKNDFNAWNGRADALNRARKYNEALAASDTAIALQPSDTRGWINRGYILYNLGRYQDELSAYETAISLEPGNAEAWFNKGYSLAGLKRYDEAIAAFDKVKDLQLDYPNLEANRKIAMQLRDAETPGYLRYAPVAGLLIIVILSAALYLLFRKRTGNPAEGIGEKETRQSRRRKEKRS